MATWVSVTALHTRATYRISQQIQATLNQRCDNFAHFRLILPRTNSEGFHYFYIFYMVSASSSDLTVEHFYLSALMHSYPKSHVKAALLLTVLLVVVITALPSHQGESISKAPVSLQLEVAEAADFVSVNEAPVKQEQIEASNSRWINITIQPGDSRAHI